MGGGSSRDYFIFSIQISVGLTVFSLIFGFQNRMHVANHFGNTFLGLHGVDE